MIGPGHVTLQPDITRVQFQYLINPVVSVIEPHTRDSVNPWDGRNLDTGTARSEAAWVGHVPVLETEGDGAMLGRLKLQHHDDREDSLAVYAD